LGFESISAQNHASLLAVVIHAVRSGAFDDWDGPAHRLVHDDDGIPEIEATNLGDSETD
jgi:nitrogen fixation-related uncharacterized protein